MRAFLIRQDAYKKSDIKGARKSILVNPLDISAENNI